MFYANRHINITKNEKDWTAGPLGRYAGILYQGVPVQILERRTIDDNETAQILRQDSGPEGWVPLDALSSTLPPDPRIDVGIPMEIAGLSWFSDDTGPGGSNSPDYLRVYRFAGVSPQTGIDNAVAAMESVGWQSESSEAISKVDLLKAHLLISGPPSLELANGLSSGKPMRRMVDILWEASDPSYLQIWYFQFDLVE